jgi:hypothetical protein
MVFEIINLGLMVFEIIYPSLMVFEIIYLGLDVLNRGILFQRPLN